MSDPLTKNLFALSEEVFCCEIHDLFKFKPLPRLYVVVYFIVNDYATRRTL